MFTKQDRDQQKNILEQLAQQQEELAALRERIDLILGHIERAKSSKKATIPREGDK